MPPRARGTREPPTAPWDGLASLPTVQLRGAEIHAITEQHCVELVMAALEARVGGWIHTLNLDALRRFVRDPAQDGHLAPGALVVADGMPLLWASRLQGTPLPERVAGSHLVWSLSEAAAERDRSLFLLGGDPGTAEASAEALRRKRPALRIAGVECPPHGFEEVPAEMERIRGVLRAADPDLVFVALGAPKQDRLIERLRRELPACWWMGVGISFSLVSGRIRQAPGWVQQIGLEWAHRLLQEPRRLARRHLLEGIPFAIELLLGAARGSSSANRTRS